LQRISASDGSQATRDRGRTIHGHDPFPLASPVDHDDQVQRSCPIDAGHEFLEGARVVDDLLLDDLGLLGSWLRTRRRCSRGSWSLSKA